MKVLNKTEQIAHNEGRSSSSAIQNMLMGYRSTPHPATGYSPYEALMRRNVKTKLDYTPLTRTTGIQQMERQISKRDKEYKKKWSKQHRQPACRKSYFEVGDKVLLKRRKINKWSTSHEKENYVIVGVNGSAIRARRKSDGRTITRDASKFKLLKMPRDEYWRERLLRSSNRRRQTSTAGERNEGAQNDGQDDRSEAQDDRTHQPHPPQRRELPKRNRRPPPRFRDFILN